MSNQANLINLEILRMARDLITNEYIDRRAQLHNKWLNDCNDQFSTLPYPDIPPYPTENEVVARAQVLLNFLLDNNQKVGGTISTSESTESEIGKIAEPVIPPINELVLENVISECTGPTGDLSENEILIETCTGPTGVASENETLIETCTGPTGLTVDSKINKSRSKNKIPMPPDEYDMAYARFKSNNREDREISTLSSVIPGLMRNIKNNIVV